MEESHHDRASDLAARRIPWQPSAQPLACIRHGRMPTATFGFCIHSAVTGIMTVNSMGKLKTSRLGRLVLIDTARELLLSARLPTFCSKRRAAAIAGNI